ncbi:MAG: S46 family peptidase, partial [Gemmataceae bacterium]|nr:S46 family peptidase [Gemmataceae bacterium]
EVLMKTYSERSAENARRATGEYLRVQNGRKLYVGMLDGLQSPAFLAEKRSAEKKLRAEVGKESEAWDEVARTVKAMKELSKEFGLLEGRARGLSMGAGFNTHYFGIARALVRHAAETKKDNAERLREYRETALPTLKNLLLSPAPIHPDFEAAKLGDSLGSLVEGLGETELVKKVLAGKSPYERASELVRATKLGDPAYRKKVLEGEASDDPFILLAKLVDEPARAVRKRMEREVEEPQAQAYGRISRAIFALRGKDQYPDATFTLRLAFGKVEGYEQDGGKVAPFTTLGGAYERAESHGNREPFHLPKRWIEKKAKLDASVPYNFVCTADIIGGNSGSPVVDKKGEVVGLIFDGNIQSLVADFAYTEKQGRAVAVDSRGIIEALRKAYGAEGLAAEITGRK